jgi:hypothetical protein
VGGLGEIKLTSETLGGDASDVSLTGRRAVQAGVADDDVL